MRLPLNPLLLWLFFVTPALAGEGPSPQQSEGPVTVHIEKTRIRLSFASDVVMFADSGQGIWGLVASGDLQFGLNRTWGLSLGVREAFSSSGFTSFFTQIHLSLVKALSGSLMASREQVFIGGVPVAAAHGALPSGWMSRLYVSEYFINTTGSVLPYTGLGLGVSYDWNWNDHIPVSVGVRLDRITNGTKSYFPVCAFATIGLWI